MLRAQCYWRKKEPYVIKNGKYVIINGKKEEINPPLEAVKNFNIANRYNAHSHQKKAPALT